jgi:hypothetical protein
VSQFALRPVEVRDLDAIFEQMRDPESVRMAAFTPEDPSDRSAFDAHMAKVMSSSENRLRAIIRDSRVVATIASYPLEAATEVTYWIDRTCWGKGLQRGRSACSSRRSRSGRSEPVLRATTPGRYESFRRRASTRSVWRCPLLRDGLPRSGRPFSSYLEHAEPKSPKEACRCNGAPAATSPLTTSNRHAPAFHQINFATHHTAACRPPPAIQNVPYALPENRLLFNGNPSRTTATGSPSLRRWRARTCTPRI